MRRWCEMRSLTVALAGILASGVLQAADESIYFSEMPVVASVSRLPQRQADAPTAVTVIDREMLRALPIRDLNDVFRLVPGFQTYPNNTDAGRVTYHGMNDGVYAPRVQVLVDGRSMYSPLFGGSVNWLTMPVAIEDIERIEVVRGTNAVTYGNNAYLGVINIITIDPAMVRGVSVSTSYGNQNVRDYALRTGGKLGESGNFRFTYRQLNDNGLTNQYDWVDSYFQRLFDFRADYALNERDSVQLSAGRVDGRNQTGSRLPEQVFPGFWVYTNPIRLVDQSDTYLQLSFRRVFSVDSEFLLRYGYTKDTSSDLFGVSLFGTTYPIDQSGDEGTRHELELQHTLRVADSARLAWGANWRTDTVHSNWYFGGRGAIHRETGRVFGNLEWKPVRWFTGNFGLAGEQDSFAGFQAHPRASANFHVTPENTIRFGVSRASRSGSIIDYRGDARAPLGLDHVFKAASNLPVDRLDTVEVGYLGDWRKWRSSLDIRLFNERIHNRLYRIDADTDDNTVPSSTIPVQNVRIRGIEYQFRWQPFESTRLLFNQTFAKIDAEYLNPVLAFNNSAIDGENRGLDAFTQQSMPRRSTSLLLIQKLPFGLEFSTAAYWQEMMKWSTATQSPKYERIDARLAYPFRFGVLGGELAYVVQSLNGDHIEYKKLTSKPDGRVVERRQWVSLRLDF